MGSTTVERRLKLHGGIDVDEKDPDWRNDSGGGGRHHRLRIGRISAECLRRRHNRVGQ